MTNMYASLRIYALLPSDQKFWPKIYREKNVHNYLHDNVNDLPELVGTAASKQNCGGI